MRKNNNSLSHQNIHLPILNKPYKSILNQIQDKGITRHKTQLQGLQSGTNQNNKNNHSAEKFMKANRFDHYNVDNEFNQQALNSESSYLNINNQTNIVSNINKHKVEMDSTLLSHKSNLNIQQTIKNMNDSAFQNSYSTYNNHNNYHNYYPQPNITIAKDNHQKSKDNTNEETADLYQSAVNSTLLGEQLNYQSGQLIDQKQIKEFLDKKGKYQEFIKGQNKQGLTLNINYQELFFKDIYQQYDFMPDNNIQLFNKYYQYEISNMKCIYKLIKENKQIKQQNQSLTEQNQQIQIVNTGNEKKLLEYGNKYDEKLNVDFSHKLVSIKDQILFENQKLKKEIEILQKQINTNDLNYLKGEFLKEMDVKKQEFQDQAKSLNEKIVSQEKMLSHQKEQQKILKNKFQILNAEHKTNLSEKNFLQMKVDDFEKKFNLDDFTKFREVNQMAVEDIYLKDELINTLRARVALLDSKYTKISIKYDNLMRQDFQITPDQQITVTQKEMIEELKQKVPQDAQLKRNMYKEAKESDKPNVIKNLNQLSQLGNRIYEPKKPGEEKTVSYQQFRLVKPGFQWLLAEKMEGRETVAEQNQGVNWAFLVKIRAILDSKHNEVMMNNLNSDQVSNISKFPEFVYSWLGLYQIDNQTRQVIMLDLRDTKPDDIRVEFLEELLQEKFAKLWEVVLFRDFLSEKADLDELYFYLGLRQKLFSGPQLSNSKAHFDYVHYISVKQMEVFVKAVLKQHSYDQVEFAIAKIRDNSRAKGNKIMVDGHFVLSVLLEFYRAERKIKFQIIRDLFFSYSNSNTSNKIFNLSFNSFKSFMDENFQYLSEIEKVTIYRECWNLGNGCVSAEVFIAIAIERNLLLKQMNVTNTFHLPIKLTSDREIDVQDPDHSHHLQIASILKDNHKFFQMLETDIEQLGNEQFYFDYLQNLSLIMQRFQVESVRLKDRALFQILHRLFQKVQTFQHVHTMKLIMTGKYDQSRTLTMLNDQLQIYIQDYNISKKEAKLQTISDNLKVINFQKFSRKKIIKFYGNLYNLLNKYKLTDREEPDQLK